VVAGRLLARAKERIKSKPIIRRHWARKTIEFSVPLLLLRRRLGRYVAPLRGRWLLVRRLEAVKAESVALRRWKGAEAAEAAVCSWGLVLWRPKRIKSFHGL
jgi:hypothetical protein